MFVVEYYRGFYVVNFPQERKYLKFKWTKAEVAQKYGQTLVESWATSPKNRNTDLQKRFVTNPANCIPAATR